MLLLIGYVLKIFFVTYNLQRVVKRTASEYQSTTPKDASTLYAVTE